MEENKFEKQVKQKLEELKIQPSDAVWENVSSRIEKRKSRRWAFLMLFLFGVVLLTGSLWFFNSKRESIATRPENENFNSIKQNQETGRINPERPNGEAIDEERDTHKQTDQAQENTGNAEIAEKNLVDKKEELKIALKSPPKSKTVARREAGKLKLSQHISQTEAEHLPNANIADKPEDAIVSTENIPSHNDIIPSQEEHKTRIDEDQKQDTSTGVALTEKLSSQRDSVNTELAKVKKVDRMPAKNKWSLGFVMAAGISHLGSEFLGLGNSSDDKLFLNAPGTSTGGGSGSGGSVQIPVSSKVQNGAAVIAGVFVERNLSAKTKFSFGANYKHFSTSNRVGARNDTTGLYSAFSPGNSYRNSFSFLEFPLNLKVQLNKSEKRPLFWNAGISLSQYLGSNALQLNPSTANFYKDNSLFNKTQIGFNTSLGIALFNAGKNTVLAGPYFSYAVTSLAKKGLYDKKHFVFFGLRTELLIKKNK